MSKYNKGNYNYKKEQARSKAIEFQYNMSNEDIMPDLIDSQNDFAKLGKRYGLLREFKENGII